MKDERKEFESAFDKEIKEVLVLTQTNPSAGKAGNAELWKASLTLLSYIDVLTDTLIQKEARLVWQLTEEECRTKEKIHNLEKEKIYHLKVRESLDGGYSLLLVEVVERSCQDRRLTELLMDYRKPVMIHLEGCGEFLLDKSLGMFDADGQWNGESCTIHLDVDEDNKKTASDASATLKKLLSNSKQWDQLARELAASRLTSTANDWQAQEEDPIEITEEAFAQRLSISELSVLTGGDFEIYYEDDDMFWGHVVIVSGNVNTGVDDADMAG